jgi:hypothetical protein
MLDSQFPPHRSSGNRTAAGDEFENGAEVLWWMIDLDVNDELYDAIPMMLMLATQFVQRKFKNLIVLVPCGQK